MLPKLLFVILFLGPSTFALENSLVNIVSAKDSSEWREIRSGQVLNRCEEELALGLIPRHCYQEPQSPELRAFLDGQCDRSAAKIEDLQILQRISRENLSGPCRASVISRAKILAYKLADKRPIESFNFLKENSGPEIVTRLPHVHSPTDQPN